LYRFVNVRFFSRASLAAVAMIADCRTSDRAAAGTSSNR
jgi:hypothetical protein